jgi:hypothetical protein
MCRRPAQRLDGSVTQLHSAGYHNPRTLPPGPVLVVGGVTDVPGLHFLGLRWQHSRGSALLGFVHEDAAYLADRITSRAPAGQPAADPSVPGEPAVGFGHEGDGGP